MDKSHPTKSRFSKPLQIAALALVTGAVILMGIAALLRGSVEYVNWWGGYVFAPAAILVAGFWFYVLVFKARALRDRSDDKKTRREKYRQIFH